MSKQDVARTIAALLPRRLTTTEERHLVDFVPAEVLGAIARAVEAGRASGAGAAMDGTLREKAAVLARRLRPLLGVGGEARATKSLADATHGVLDALLAAVPNGLQAPGPRQAEPALELTLVTALPDAESVRASVVAYIARFGGDDELARDVVPGIRAALVAGGPIEPVHHFVWTIRTWGRVQGPSQDDRAAMVKALFAMPWAGIEYDAERFDEATRRWVEGLLVELVEGSVSAGAAKRHWSWASKILHWLLPGTLPVYDDVVRRVLGIPERLAEPERWRRIVRWEYAAARALLSDREIVTRGLPGHTLVRALDQHLWWVGGGRTSATWDRPSAALVGTRP